jgi:hypothetical protein
LFQEFPGRPVELAGHLWEQNAPLQAPAYNQAVLAYFDAVRRNLLRNGEDGKFDFDAAEFIGADWIEPGIFGGNRPGAMGNNLDQRPGGLDLADAPAEAPALAQRNKRSAIRIELRHHRQVVGRFTALGRERQGLPGYFQKHLPFAATE